MAGGVHGMFARGFNTDGTEGLYARGFGVAASSSGTGSFGSGGTGSQTGGTTNAMRRRRGRRGHFVNPLWLLRKWLGRE